MNRIVWIVTDKSKEPNRTFEPYASKTRVFTEPKMVVDFARARGFGSGILGMTLGITCLPGIMSMESGGKVDVEIMCTLTDIPFDILPAEPNDAFANPNKLQIDEVLADIAPPNMRSYYEIICGETVIGVCSGEEHVMVHVAKEDRVTAFGELTDEQYQAYDEKPWEKPRSARRWNVKVINKLHLEPFKA